MTWWPATASCRAITVTTSPGSRSACRLARDGAGHDAEPVLRFGSTGDHRCSDGRGQRRPGSGGGRRRRIDVTMEPHRGFVDHRRIQPGLSCDVSDSAARCFSGPDCYGRRVHPRGCRRLRRLESTAGCGGDQRGAILPDPDPGHRRRRRRGVGPRRTPVPARPATRWRSCVPHSATLVPRTRRARRTASTRSVSSAIRASSTFNMSITQVTPRGWSTVRRRRSSPRMTGCGHTASPPAPGSVPRRRSDPNRSSC